MAGYKYQPVLMSDVAEMESYRLRRDMFDGNEDGTRVKLVATSGFIDPYTEEITYANSETWLAISGILGTIVEGDELLGEAGGRLRVGDTMVTYHYDTVSGIYLQNKITDIEIVTPAASGFYHVVHEKIGTIGGRPMFLKVGLILDSND